MIGDRLARRALIAATLLAVATIALSSLTLFDFWWYLASGQRILEARSIPKTDPFSYTAEGRPWINHMWATQILFTLLWEAGGRYALIALKTLRADLPEAPTGARIEEGERLLLDRVCEGGGWNYGNSRVYDEELWPYPDTTALALLALQDHPHLPEVRSSLDALDRMVARNDSLLATSLALLCGRVYGRPVETLSRRLAAHLETASPWVDVRALALAGLALRKGPVPMEFAHA